MKDLAGKTLLVAGAGRGIGKVITLEFTTEKTRGVNTGKASATLETIQIDSGANS